MYCFSNTMKSWRLFSFILFIFVVHQLKSIDGEFVSSYTGPGTQSYQDHVALRSKLRELGIIFNGPVAGSPTYIGTFAPKMPPISNKAGGSAKGSKKGDDKPADDG